jgi:hypothetical protein
MRRLLLLLALTVAPLAFGATADLRILSIFPTKTELLTGERFTATMRWRNDGPDAAGDVVATLSGGTGAFVVTAAGTSHWPCEPDLRGESFTCRGIIPAGGEAEMVVTMLAPPVANGGNFTLTGTIASSAADPAPANNTMLRTLQLTTAPRHADLALAPSEQTQHAAAGSVFTMPLLVSNAGPDDAHDVIVSLSFVPGSLIPITVTGDGWSCHNATHSPQLVACSRSNLAAGVTSQLTVSVTAPQHDGSYPFNARISAEQYADASLDNQQSFATLQVGGGTPAAAWTRFLVPLIPTETPGANGSLWKTETTMLIRSDTPVTVEPSPCDLLQPCDGETSLPTQVPFSIAGGGFSFGPGDRGGQFIYVPAADAPKIALNSRVWDLSRVAQTAGSEIPIVRESRFTTTTIALVGIPVAPHYRHTLRIYGLEGRAGARVAIRLYANDETQPRAATTAVLTLSPYARTTTSENLPTHPGYLELKPAALLPSMEGITSLHIEVDPLDAGDHLWSFVSVTNNDTHHVTTISAR